VRFYLFSASLSSLASEHLSFELAGKIQSSPASEIAGHNHIFRAAIMQAFTVDKLRQRLDDILAMAETEEILIARDSGDNLMLVTEAGWRALQETAHLLATSLNEERLQQSLQQLRDEHLSRYEKK
jgi:antitoxin YefM